MASYISERKEEEKAPGGQEKVLEALLEMVHFWQSKGTSPREAKEAVGSILARIKEKVAGEIDLSKISLETLFAQLMKPGHFNPAEKKIIQTLFLEAVKLKKKLDIGEGRRVVLAKNKNRFKRPVEKKLI